MSKLYKQFIGLLRHKIYYLENGNNNKSSRTNKRSKILNLLIRYLHSRFVTAVFCTGVKKY